MENASKALIIAGEILIALLIIGLLLYGYNNVSNLSKQQQTEKEVEQLVAFNKEYESYNRKLLRGVDVISVINKAIDNNKKYENEEYYKINITFEMAEECVYYKETTNGETTTNKKAVFTIGKIYSMEEFFSNIKVDTDAFTDFKRRIFDCTKIDYNATSGRVNYMHFKERELTTNEYENGL